MTPQPCASDIHGPGDDECLGARCLVGPPRLPTPGTVCARHGERLHWGRCWECDAERDIAERDRNEHG